MSGRRGSSLLETVISLFILAAAMMVTFQLFFRATQWQGHVELRATALAAARQKLEEVRVASLEFDDFEAGLPAQVGTTSVTGHPDLQVTVVISDLSTGSRQRCIPSRSFEETFAGAPVPNVFSGAVTDDRKILNASLLGVDVTVGSLDNRILPVTLTALIREPARIADRVEISAPSDLDLSYLETAVFTAEVYDSNNKLIRDAVIRWTVEPISGYGTVNQARNGSVGALSYVDYDHNDVAFQPPSGQCSVRATATIEGKSVFSVSAPVTLQP